MFQVSNSFDIPIIKSTTSSEPAIIYVSTHLSIVKARNKKSGTLLIISRHNEVVDRTPPILAVSRWPRVGQKNGGDVEGRLHREPNSETNEVNKRAEGGDFATPLLQIDAPTTRWSNRA